jgi:hypothetical protein
VLASNPLYDAVFGDLAGHPQLGRNTVWAVCCSPGAERFFEDHAAAVRDNVAGLRLAFANFPDSTAFHELLAVLRRDMPDFDRLWAQQNVAVKAQGQRVIRHARVGRLLLRWHSLAPLEAAGQRVKLFEPADDASAHALERLAS